MLSGRWMLKLSWIAAFASLGISETQSGLVCSYAVWIYRSYHFSWQHGPWWGQEEKCRRQVPRFLPLRGVSFDYSNFLTVTRLAIGAHAAIFNGVFGNVVLRVSEQSRRSYWCASSCFLWKMFSLTHKIWWDVTLLTVLFSWTNWEDCVW